MILTWIAFSFYGSKAEVASSNTKIFGLRANALAIDNLCFCPPDKKLPLGPTDLKKPFGSVLFLEYYQNLYAISSYYEFIPKFAFSMKS